MAVTGPARLVAKRAGIAALIAAVFAIDTVTRLEIAVGVLYVVPLLLAARLSTRREVLALAGLCVLLLIVSFSLTRSGAREAGFVNLAISIAAVSVTVWLGRRLLDAEAAFHEARAQLLRVARVTSLGQLAASIAHEVNQPLAAISASSAAARRWLAADPPDVARAGETLARIGADAERAGEVVTRMRSLARHEPPTRSAIDVNAIVAGALALARAELDRRQVAVTTHLAAPLPTLRVDRVQIEQVVVNLVLNAVEAMAALPASARALTVTTRTGADRHLLIEIADSGPGIADADLPRLFDAFWTTKRGGTGLGLTISRTIVELHGGLLRVERPADRGARFVIDFPPPR